LRDSGVAWSASKSSPQSGKHSLTPMSVVRLICCQSLLLVRETKATSIEMGSELDSICFFFFALVIAAEGRSRNLAWLEVERLRLRAQNAKTGSRCTHITFVNAITRLCLPAAISLELAVFVIFSLQNQFTIFITTDYRTALRSHPKWCLHAVIEARRISLPLGVERHDGRVERPNKPRA
jgi:hypothetical protein